MSETTEQLESERQLLGSIASINDALRALADVVEGDGHHFGERIRLLERRQCQVEQVLQQIVAHLGEQQGAGDWWRTGAPPPGGNGDA
jgi:hypothetical protein